MKKNIIILAGVVILIAVGGWYYTRSPQVVDTVSESMEEPVVAEPVVTDGVLASNQAAGDIVAVESAVFTKPGYIVIHQDAEGSPGPVIGNSDLLSGSNQNVSVTLSRASLVGENLYAMLHFDNGDGVYEFPGDDLPARDAEGNVVLMKFSITE